MSQDSHISTQDLLNSLFRNIVQQQCTDHGTAQSLLLHILTTAIEDPRKLASDFASAVTGSSKLMMANKEDEDKLAKKSQLFFLTFENIIFNVYSKLKTSETVKLQDSLYHTQASISYSILNLDSSRQVLHHTKFTTFMQNLLGNQHLYEDLMSFIPKTYKPENSQMVAMQIKNLISTFDYITDREGIKSDTYGIKRNKFSQYLRVAPEKHPVKQHLRNINKVIFSGNTSKLAKLISTQKDKPAFQMSVLRIYHYYRRNVSNPKFFESNAINGQEIIQRMINAYVASKSKGPKDHLFRENRSTEPLLDFLLSYMTFYFLPVLRSFDDYLEKFLLPYANLDASGFFSMFVVQGLQQGRKIIEAFPIEFKDFLRKLYAAINSAGFSDKLSSTAPVKTLIFVRFFFNYDIRGLLCKTGNDVSKKQDPSEFLKVGNYFKDLFYEASLKKYSFIPEFNQAYNQLNDLFEDILTKKKAYKGELQIPNYLRFYVTKPLLRYDYAIVKQGLDEEAAHNNHSDDFEVDSSIEGHNIKKAPSPDKKALQLPIKEEKSPNKALKRIIDGDEDLSGSIDEPDFLHNAVHQKPKEEFKEVHHHELHDFINNKPLQINPNNRGSQNFKGHGHEFEQQEEEYEQEQQEEEYEVDFEEEEEEEHNARYFPQQSDNKAEKLQESQKKEYGYEEMRGQQSQKKDNHRSQGSSMMEGRRDEQESWVDKFEKESEMKIKMVEMEHNKEKTLLMNRLGVLEEKYAMVLDTLGNVKMAKGQENIERKDRGTENEEQGKNEVGNYRKERQKRKEDKAFYELHNEIVKEREKVLQAELEYIMHKRVNFPGGIH